MNGLIVIIPFYQKEPGILNRALKSIDNQVDISSINQVVIVDDGSPVSAINEINDLSNTLISKLHIIKQENQGVSRARNVGLAYANNNGQYIAFLDSDDIWQEHHISLMMQAFELGAQFYFANFFQPGQTIGAFERGQKLQLDEHSSLGQNLYCYEKDMIQQILVGNLIGTPTVGFKIDGFSELRFKENLRFAGEDYLFWLDIAKQQPKIIFSNKITVHCGKGVNIFASAKWGTMHLQHRLTDELNFRKSVISSYQLNEETLAHVTSSIWQSRKQIILNGLSLLKHRQWQVITHLTRTIVSDPKILVAAFSH